MNRGELLAVPVCISANGFSGAINAELLCAAANKNAAPYVNRRKQKSKLVTTIQPTYFSATLVVK